MPKSIFNGNITETGEPQKDYLVRLCKGLDAQYRKDYLVHNCRRSEKNYGLRALLSHSKWYNLFQTAMGAKKGRAIFSSTHIRAKNGDCILDIGCGTAETRDYLPEVKYYGFDPNPRYIDAAKQRLQNVPDCELFCATAEEALLSSLPKFDIVLAVAVIHHLSDEEAVRLARLAKNTLKDKGRFVLLDPCFVEGQSPIARFLASLDRGMYVRDANSYKHLMNTTFSVVKTEIRHDLARFPYTHLIMECMEV